MHTRRLLHAPALLIYPGMPVKPYQMGVRRLDRHGDLAGDGTRAYLIRKFIPADLSNSCQLDPVCIWHRWWWRACVRAGVCVCVMVWILVM